MVAEGYPNKTIAAVLDISSWTVCTHMRRMFAKLNVRSRAAMVAKLLEERSAAAKEQKAKVSSISSRPSETNPTSTVEEILFPCEPEGLLHVDLSSMLLQFFLRIVSAAHSDSAAIVNVGWQSPRKGRLHSDKKEIGMIHERCSLLTTELRGGSIAVGSDDMA